MYNNPRVNPEENDELDNSVNEKRREFIERLKDHVNRLLDYYNLDNN